MKYLLVVKLWLLSLLLMVVVPWQTAAAQSLYPQPEDLYVNDFGNVISAVDEEGLRTLLTDFYEQEGVEMTVLTVGTYREYGTDDVTINDFATNLFNDWGIGDAERNDGVLFLVAAEDRELKIELGDGYGPEYDERIQNIIDTVIIPYFRNDNYSLGIYEGSRAIIADLTGQPYESLRESSESPAPTRSLEDAPVVSSSDDSSSSRNSGNALPYVAGAGGVGLLGGLVYYFQRFRRNRPRPCPQCQTMMVRLDEVADDAFLDEGQQKEEELQSVDYDAWQCPNCQHHELQQYKGMFSRYQSCPQCNYQTLESSSRVVQQPTYTSTGVRRTEQNCRQCQYQRSSDSTIARLHRNTTSSSSSSFRSSSSSRSSSSRSSFGGGRSSGRGGRGKW